MKKGTVYNNAKKLYIKLLSIYYDDYKMRKKKRLTKSLLLKGQRFIESKKEEKSKSQPEESIAERVKLRRQKAYDKDLLDMSLPCTDENNGDSDKFVDTPPLESDEEEVKEGKRLKILAPDKLLTRLPIRLAQIRAGKNSHKLKNEIRRILYFLYQHNKITKKVCNNLMKSL